MVTDNIFNKDNLKKSVNDACIKMRNTILPLFIIEQNGYITLRYTAHFLFYILAFCSIAFSRGGIRLHNLIFDETGEAFTYGPVHWLALSFLFLALLAFFYFRIFNIYKKLSSDNFNHFISWIFIILSTSMAFYSFVALFFKIYIDSMVHLNIGDYFSLLGVLMTFLFVVITFLSIREYKKTNIYSSSRYEIKLIGEEINFYQTLLEHFNNLSRNVNDIMTIIELNRSKNDEILKGKEYFINLEQYYVLNSYYDIDEFTKDYPSFFLECGSFYAGEIKELNDSPSSIPTTAEDGTEAEFVPFNQNEKCIWGTKKYSFLMDLDRAKFLQEISIITSELRKKITSKQKEQAQKYKEFKSNLNR